MVSTELYLIVTEGLCALFLAECWIIWFTYPREDQNNGVLLFVKGKEENGLHNGRRAV